MFNNFFIDLGLGYSSNIAQVETIRQFADGDRRLSHKQTFDDNIRCRMLADGGICSGKIDLSLAAGQVGQCTLEFFFNVGGAHGEVGFLLFILVAVAPLVPETRNINYAFGRIAFSYPAAILVRIQYQGSF